MTSRFWLAAMLTLALTLPPASMMVVAQAGAGRNGPPRPQGPCDIYAAAGTPCVTAHSTTRALSASYNGPLYQVLRQSDGKTLDIGLVQPSASDPGGYADAAAQDAFCADTLCVITKLYDQSGRGNDLLQAPPGPSFPGPAKGGFDTQPIADMAPITIGGHKAYGVYIMPGMGFRNNNATGLAIEDEPEGMYSVFDGKHFDSGCCFDYGNAETNSAADGPGTMENTYFGTSTTWGSGDGPGPWIMADMEDGLYSGYNSRKNLSDPTIDSWRFVTAVVNGGGGNKWDLRGANAQQGTLTTYYSGNRPGSRETTKYFPMHKQGAVLMGTGGDNGNGSAGTYFEGAMTFGYPTDAAIDAIQANIVAAKYDVQRVALSRLKTFIPGSSQDVTVTFTNTTGAPATGTKLNLALPPGWTSVLAGTAETVKSLADPVAPGASVNAIFKVTSPATPGAGFVSAKAQWIDAARQTVSESSPQRVRNALPIKINEVQLTNPSSQFIELYNASSSEVDLSNWSLINTQSQWAPVKLATIPAGAKIAPKSFFLLGQSASGLAAPTQKGDAIILVRSTTGFAVGQQINVDGETRKIATAGTPAAPMTTVFIPVATGPWLTFPAGTTNLPVANAAGFEVGQKITIDLGGNLELATVTAVGKAATQTTLSADVAAGATSIRVLASSNIQVGNTLTVGAGGRKELVTVKNIERPAPGGNAAAAAPGRGGAMGGRGGGVPATIELTAPLKFAHLATVDVSDVGTGITFTPATKFPHLSGDAVQALGAGVTLDQPLDNPHEYGAAVVNGQAVTAGYQGPPAPQQWFGGALSPRAGSIALLDPTGKIVVDAIVYGSQQSNSSGNGTITSPELATLEGEQHQGGCIAVVPQPPRGGRGGAPAAPAGPGRSVARTSDGADADNLCTDFRLQAPTPGAPNQNSQ
jgi:non-reducing end alpha-L-arabinofuranosidase